MTNPTPPRPAKFSPEIIAAVAERLLPSVQEHLGDDSNGEELADLKSALGDCSYDSHWEGYKLAKSLDDHYYWGEVCDTHLCEILDNADTIAHKIVQLAVSEWVKANKIEPPFPVGTAVEFTSGYSKITGKVAAINYGTAEYTVQEDGRTYAPSESGFVAGYIVPYEVVKAIETEDARGSTHANGTD
jgi:hypothetical protein